MQFVFVLLNIVRWAIYTVWGGIGILAIIGFFANGANKTRPRGASIVLRNFGALIAIFGVPLSLASLLPKATR